MIPACLCSARIGKLTFDPAAVLFTRKHPLELVIFCGSPGSGKSTYFWNHLKPLGYERVNQDILKTVRVVPRISSKIRL